MHYDQLNPPAPDESALESEYRDLVARLQDAATIDAASDVLDSWMATRKQVNTWRTLARVRFRQDTTDEDRRANRAQADAFAARLFEMELDVFRVLLTSPLRAELEAKYGTQIFAVWACESESFDPAIAEDYVANEELAAKYMELTAQKFEFRGEKRSLSALSQFLSSDDRETRRDADAARWKFFDDRGEALDQIFDEMVQLRTRMARKLGYDNFIDLGYRAMTRVGYGQEDVARFRQEVRDSVVPVAAELRARQASALGLDALSFYDERIHDLEQDPRPLGDLDWIVNQTDDVLDEMHPTLGEFWSMMRRDGLIDLPTRDGKAGGGFCAWLGTEGKPFIFANFAGVRGDIKVLVHEVGHAYQHWMCRDKQLNEYVGATAETCEIHSMSLEYLSWPWMDRYFGDSAERYRRAHLTDGFCFIPYGVAVDHFQHMVYGNPEASPAERHAMWKQCEAMYLPWRHYDDEDSYAARGGFWQVQRHIFMYPFYYIDYTLAGTVALQLWAASQDNHADAMDTYLQLCKRGGEAAFADLVVDAGLRSPFTPGCLGDVAGRVRTALDLS